MSLYSCLEIHCSLNEAREAKMLPPIQTANYLLGDAKIGTYSLVIKLISFFNLYSIPLNIEFPPESSIF